MKIPVSSFREEIGASAVEYSLLVVLIAAVVVATVTVAGWAGHGPLRFAHRAVLMTRTRHVCSLPRTCDVIASREADPK